jgi:hypothetical protein
MKRIRLAAAALILAAALLSVEVIIVRSASRYEPEVSVVYAKAEIPQGSKITPEMLEGRKVSVRLIHRKAFRHLEDVVGKWASAHIEAGEMILGSRLCEEMNTEKIEVKDKKNRLFTVEFKNDQANGWWLAEDQYVDIIFIPNERVFMKQGPAGAYENEEAANAGGSRTSLEAGKAGDEFYQDIHDYTYTKIKRLSNVRIAALIDDKGKLINKSDRSAVPRLISFEVDIRQDEFLAYAKGNGRLEISAIPGD